ncbi:pro-Pol polyprotein [Nephila pilipes]|uniref:Pro-Pol polyprotein n=1 Tax=Nephila pilipes TaxID=299642 RepID=A0A8X6ULY4_NEPPI|nr:pro-Pol polyprotein [Nephila pilipes]GFU44311.1 pro-Pol polyprotein [Nephila pilipes]
MSIGSSTEQGSSAEGCYNSSASTASGLHWYQTGTKSYRRFKIREREIRLISKLENWHYVPGSMNPADLPFRVCSARQLLETEWWHGPPWFYYPSDKWLRSEFSGNEEVLKEKRKEIITSMVSLQKIDNSFIYKFSSYSKTVIIVARILRFINSSRISRNSQECGILDSEEISVAEYAVRMIQKEIFINEEDEKLKTLRAFKDKNSIIRLKTKILYRPDSEDFKVPVILPSKNELVNPCSDILPQVSAAETVLVREKLPNTKLSEQTAVSNSVNCNVEPSEEKRKTRSGRVVKIPLKLDL